MNKATNDGYSQLTKKALTSVLMAIYEALPPDEQEKMLRDAEYLSANPLAQLRQPTAEHREES